MNTQTAFNPTADLNGLLRTIHDARANALEADTPAKWRAFADLMDEASEAARNIMQAAHDAFPDTVAEPDCTDCEGSGITHQTEVYCTCAAGQVLKHAPTGCTACGWTGLDSGLIRTDCAIDGQSCRACPHCGTDHYLRQIEASDIQPEAKA